MVGREVKARLSVGAPLIGVRAHSRRGAFPFQSPADGDVLAAAAAAASSPLCHIGPLVSVPLWPPYSSLLSAGIIGPVEKARRAIWEEDKKDE